MVFIMTMFEHRWAQTANPLISEASFFTNGLAVQLTSKMLADWLSKLIFSANPLIRKKKNGCYRGFNKEKPLSCHVFPFFVPEKYLPVLF